MTIGAIDFTAMSDEELKRRSLEKRKDGTYTAEANRAYAERQRRSNALRYSGVANRCGKFYNDYIYNGCEAD